MKTDEIARIINPEYPWVYAPTTAPTKLYMKDGDILVGFFQYTQKSDELEKKNYLTFVEFGEKANLYRATGHPKYITDVDASLIRSVEYPAKEEKSLPLDMLMRRISVLFLELEKRNLTNHQAILLAPQFRLDWGFHIENNSDEFSAGETKMLLAEGLSRPTSEPWDTNALDDNKVAVLLNEFFTINKLTAQVIQKLYCLMSGATEEFRQTEVVIHKRMSGDFNYVPPALVSTEITKLVSWYNESIGNTRINPVFLAGMFHYRLVTIHPFLDGNGRLARIMASLILLKSKIPPPRLTLNDRIYYLAALESADNGNYEEWLQYFATKVMHSMEQLLSNNCEK